MPLLEAESNGGDMLLRQGRVTASLMESAHEPPAKLTEDLRHI